jgi:histidine triad (HIT) family protein
MPDMPAYEPDNIFAKILRQEIPSYKIYEDAETYAFLDIMPRADGHCLVIPKTPARNMLDATPEQLAACLHTTQHLSHAAMRAFGATGVTIQQFNETDGGQEVFHLHYHILPRHAGVALRPPGQMADQEVLAGHAARYGDALRP